MTENTSVIISGREIPLSILRHARARRISLRLSPARDGIILTLPKRASVEAGMKFFNSKTQWVLAHVQSDGGIRLADGAVIPVLGNEVTIRHLPGRGLAQLHENSLSVHGAPEFTARRVRDFLKHHLQQECTQRAQAMAAAVGKRVNLIRVRDTRSRWGSCTAEGYLTFNWRLVFASADILDYLVAHEVAHLVEMNHSPRFWQVVEQLFPDHAKARHWLKQYGHRLHSYG